MSSSPLVSAVIIFLNAEPFIEEAIESVFAQTYRSWELMLVDDGSTDGSTAIARRYAAANPDRVHYLEHPGHANRGMSASRNLGVRESKGEYVAFLDSDDVWLPLKLKEQAAILDARPSAGMVYGVSEYWHSWSLGTGLQDEIHELGIQANTLNEPPTLLTLFMLGKVRSPCPSDVMVRRSTWECVGGFEDDFRGLYEDQAFLAKVYLKTAVFVAGERWSRHRRHPESFMAVTRKAAPKHPAGIQYLSWLENYLTEEGFADRQLWDALRKKKWRYRHPVLHRLLSRIRRPARLATALLGKAMEGTRSGN